MKFKILICSFLVNCACSYAQDCKKTISAADKIMVSQNKKITDYDDAIKYYEIAKRDCPDMANDIDKKIENVTKEKNNLDRQYALAQSQRVPVYVTTVTPNQGIISDYSNQQEAPKPFESQNNKPSYKIIETENFYFDFKRKFDLLIANKQNKAESLKDEIYVNTVEIRLNNGIDGFRETNFLFDSTNKQISSLLKENKLPPENLLYLYLRAAMNYSWNLVDKNNYDSAIIILNDANRLIGATNFSSAKIFFAISSLENEARYIYREINKTNSYDHGKKALQYCLNAALLNTDNVYYKRALAVYLKNITYVSDSVLLNTDKVNYNLLSNQLADSIINSKINYRYIYSLASDYVQEKSEDLVNAGMFHEAEELLLKYAKIFDIKAKTYNDEHSNVLLLVKIYNKLSDIANFNIKDKEKQKKYTGYALNKWLELLNNDKNLHAGLIYIQDIYSDLIRNINDCFSNTEQLNSKAKIIEALININEQNKDIRQVAYILMNSYLSLGEFYKGKTKADSAVALNYFNRAITVFENASLIQYYKSTDFSEDIALFCKPYIERLAVDINNDDIKKVEADFNKIKNLFLPYYLNNRFDFYLGQPIVKAYKFYGNYLFEKGKYAQALQGLKFASFEGVKESTDLIAEIYSKEGFKNSDSLQFYLQRTEYQSSGMKRISVPTDFAGIKQNFYIYIIDRPKEYPLAYSGIQDQAMWVLKARGGVVPADVISSFNILQKKAWDDKRSFKDLTTYTLDLIEESKVLDKYKPLKSKIDSTSGSREKLIFYKKLFDEYENDLAKDTDNSKIILNDAVEFYNEYADYLVKNRNYYKGSEIYQRILYLESDNKNAIEGLLKIKFREKQGNIEELTKNESLDNLSIFLGYFLEIDDTQNADLILNKILAINDNAEIRYKLSNIYFKYTNESNTQKLFLSDTAKIKTYRDYFIDFRLLDIKDNSLKRVYYYNLVELDKYVFKSDTTEDFKTEFSRHYNSLGWYSLLSKQFDNVEYYFNKSIKYDSSSLYPYGNLPHAYLFNNQFEKAKSLYLGLKDLPFDKEAGYPTFKDAFLSDFKDFEAVGILNDNIKEIIRLLNEK